MDRPVPEPGRAEILIEVSACGVCHTELDEVEGTVAGFYHRVQLTTRAGTPRVRRSTVIDDANSSQ